MALGWALQEHDAALLRELLTARRVLALAVVDEGSQS